MIIKHCASIILKEH